MQKKKSILNGVLFITHGSGVRGDRNFPLASPGTAVHVRRQGGRAGASRTESSYGKMIRAPWTLPASLWRTTPPALSKGSWFSWVLQSELDFEHVRAASVQTIHHTQKPAAFVKLAHLCYDAPTRRAEATSPGAVSARGATRCRTPSLQETRLFSLMVSEVRKILQCKLNEDPI